MRKRYASLFLLVVILILLPTPITARLRDGFQNLFEPVGEFFVHQNINIRNFFNNIASVGELKDQKSQLSSKVAQLEQQISDKKSLEEENANLRKELGVTGVTHDYTKVLAHTTGWTSDPLDKTFTIDVGSAQKIAIGQPVVANGYLIGRISEVRTNTSTVRSILSKKSKVQARISEIRENALVSGEGNAADLTDVSQGIEVKEGSIIETSGLGGSLPQGILIGEVGPALSKQSELSQSFKVTLPYDLKSVETSFVLLTDSE